MHGITGIANIALSVVSGRDSLGHPGATLAAIDHVNLFVY
jgi:hypothetical protein